MNLVDSLLDTARLDTDLLAKNDSRGDDFSVARDVQFVLYAPDKKKAEIVASFIDDNRYGAPVVEASGAAHRITVTVSMPTTQNLICSVSALMVCISNLFSVEYDGWGCVIHANKAPSSRSRSGKR